MKNRALVRGPVKAFGPDGVLRRQRFSIEDAEYLLKKKLVFGRRNTRGEITCIWFYGDSAFPHQPRFSAGTRYSVEEQVGGFSRAWKHKRKARSSRDIYLAVIVSLIAPSQPTHNNVVSIDAFKSRRQAQRPALLAA